LAQSFVEALKHTYLSTHSKINTLCLLPAKGYQQLIYNWNHTHCSYNTKLTLSELFATQAEKTPKAIALVDENASVTYEKLEKSTNQFAYYLHAMGVKNGMRIIIKMSRHIGYIQSIMAILKCGAAYIPLTDDTPDERAEEIIKSSQAKWLITDQNNFRLKHAADVHVLYFKQLLEASTQVAEKNSLPIKTDSQSICYVTYTSGSTGKPKGVQITHRSVINILFDMRKRLKKDFRFLLITDFTFDISNLEIFLPLVFGGIGLLVNVKNMLMGIKN
jgi:non-ribosomal peptide synthetase component F